MSATPSVLASRFKNRTASGVYFTSAEAADALQEINAQAATIAKLREALDDIWHVTTEECSDRDARGWIEVHSRTALADTED